MRLDVGNEEDDEEEEEVERQKCALCIPTFSFLDFGPAASLCFQCKRDAARELRALAR